MMQLITVSLLLLYVLMAAFLETMPGSRIVFADLLLVLFIAFTIWRAVFFSKLIVPHVYMAALPMFFAFSLSGLFAVDTSKALFELLVVVFSFVGALAILNIMLSLSECRIQSFVRGYILAIGALAVVCMLDFFLFPGLISSRQLGGLQGPFRNTGQAGSFFGVHGAIMIAVVFGGLVPRKPIYILAVTSVILALLFTFKRASIVGFATGLLFASLLLISSSSMRNKKIAIFGLALFSACGLLGAELFFWGLDNVPGMRWRFEYKINSNPLDRFINNFGKKNLNSTIEAVSDRPVLGVGLNNVTGIYQRFEIHSTYLAVIAYGGVIGVVSYIFFMLMLLRAMWAEAKCWSMNAWSRFLFYFIPFFLGLTVAWAYTYHIRKREFWFLVGFALLAVHLSRWSRRKKSVKQCGEEVGRNSVGGSP